MSGITEGTFDLDCDRVGEMEATTEMAHPRYSGQVTLCVRETPGAAAGFYPVPNCHTIRVNPVTPSPTPTLFPPLPGPTPAPTEETDKDPDEDGVGVHDPFAFSPILDMFNAEWGGTGGMIGFITCVFAQMAAIIFIVAVIYWMVMKMEYVRAEKTLLSSIMFVQLAGLSTMFVGYAMAWPIVAVCGASAILVSLTYFEVATRWKGAKGMKTYRHVKR